MSPWKKWALVLMLDLWLLYFGYRILVFMYFQP